MITEARAEALRPPASEFIERWIAFADEVLALPDERITEEHAQLLLRCERAGRIAINLTEVCGRTAFSTLADGRRLSAIQRQVKDKRIRWSR